jgi:hypothetical protein
MESSSIFLDSFLQDFNLMNVAPFTDDKPLLRCILTRMLAYFAL